MKWGGVIFGTILFFFNRHESLFSSLNLYLNALVVSARLYGWYDHKPSLGVGTGLAGQI